MTKSNLCLLNIYCACIKPLIFVLNWCIHLFYTKKKKKCFIWQFLSCPLILTQHTFYISHWRNVKCLVLDVFIWYCLKAHLSFLFLPSLPSLRVSKTMSIARDESILQTWLWTTNSKLNLFQNRLPKCFEIIAEWTSRSSHPWALISLR